MSIEAYQRDFEPNADYREPPNIALLQEVGALYLQEKPGTEHFRPKVDAPVSLELTIEATNLTFDARQVIADRQPRDPKSPFPEDTQEVKQNRLQMTGEAFQRMKEAISSSSPEDVSTMLSLANKLLGKSGIQFVYNSEGYIDLQAPDGHIDMLAQPRSR